LFIVAGDRAFRKEEGRRKKEEGRGKEEEGRRKKEGGRRKKEKRMLSTVPDRPVNCQLSTVESETCQ
jgi:hypothetical protein